MTLILSLGCASTPQPEPETPAAPSTSTPETAEDAGAEAPAADPVPEPDAAAEAVYRALSVRDPVPTCEGVEALTETPVETLLYIVDHAQQPPWAGMRAAECLSVGHPEEAREAMEGWVSSSETKGLAILVLNNLDAMPLEVALSVAGKALEGPEAEAARTRIERSATPEIKALLE